MTKISPEQAERAVKLLNSFSEAYKNGASLTWLAQFQTTIYELVHEIEAANQPPEIRWCVRHTSRTMREDGRCWEAERNGWRKECEIWTYAPKKREE